MLSLDEYDNALAAYTDGATQILRVNVKAAVAMISSMPKMCWDLTRPGACLKSVDLTPRLTDVPGLVDKMERLEVVVILDEDGGPLIGYGRAKSVNGEVLFKESPDMTHDQRKFVTGLIDDTLKDMGVDRNHPGLMSMDKLLKHRTEKTIEDEVAAFSGELDSLFETWKGGDSP